ncbi:TIGR03617 family F420-dependent LLM class oxidoreductase [Streptomyces sp. NPDC090052]|uniref:TIGR03617 family F420-dependent LLM class oxidoreductase n=1 Tax=unclassified Streptomyces TaxID=2593676 RepID=UPI0022515001|nr:TIGR03617 family F420-dependent LLM class oxidoreductase [Streptomyces sp. NBC_01306]MCX4728813.1 TIGR03617 family F420-dependent LLM class oxidoreductase [Streptomyces sp. NBC_01306]WSX46463.1 TIGR03617 family F420-dependent LLM class oxidoreductase [Streptomyces sp. NBC_00963]
MTVTPHTPGPLKLDTTAIGAPSEVIEAAVAAERRGVDRILMSETAHEPFQPLAVAASRTSAIEVGTGVAIAFARTPMTLASSAWTLQQLSRGRAVIGLGSQIKAHITRRFAMPWSSPAARMKEFVSATRTIWNSWQTGEKLQFRGEFYTHTLMNPLFDPGPLEQGEPLVLIAAVGPRMAATAGAVGDGVICHPFSTVPYITEQLAPGVLEARAEATADGAPWTTRPFEITGSVLTVTGRTEEEYGHSLAGIRERIAFYGSTPAYRPVLEHHGWGALQEELHTLSLQGRWKEMGQLIDADVLNAFAVVAETPAEAGRLVRERYTGVYHRVSVSLAAQSDPALALDILDGIRS